VIPPSGFGSIAVWGIWNGSTAKTTGVASAAAGVAEESAWARGTPGVEPSGRRVTAPRPEPVEPCARVSGERAEDATWVVVRSVSSIGSRRGSAPASIAPAGPAIRGTSGPSEGPKIRREVGFADAAMSLARRLSEGRRGTSGSPFAPRSTTGSGIGGCFLSGRRGAPGSPGVSTGRSKRRRASRSNGSSIGRARFAPISRADGGSKGAVSTRGATALQAPMPVRGSLPAVAVNETRRPAPSAQGATVAQAQPIPDRYRRPTRITDADYQGSIAATPRPPSFIGG
jgi:hypothetical protein